MKVFIHVFLLALITGQVAQAQTENRGPKDLVDKLNNGSSVVVHLDSLVEEHYYRHLIQNRQQTGVAGYRIRIYSDNGLGAKDNQKRVRARFLSLYPEIDAYYRYDGTYFKLYVGDCRTKSEAHKLLSRIRPNFPEAFIVQDDIKIEK